MTPKKKQPVKKPKFFLAKKFHATEAVAQEDVRKAVATHDFAAVAKIYAEYGSLLDRHPEAFEREETLT